ncbi:FAD-binding oxidoreductase [Enterovirga sp.]|uniref:NAD(P)/FAD-dependent oxidoreductase n=1 Tax=Enterovirga sp. TaxID=2026350 RepID=UPI002B7D7E75|nr:FAD-binding oxidoreductase [Enterovirga sp.]HMO27803.1 FAD-binding oxidoreductase [Enterovirga sp.]
MASSADSVKGALWTTTAREAAPSADPFEPGRSVDVAIVGGGFTGASAALAAASHGASVALVEARTIGWGASGRNGGQVIPGLKLDPSEMRAAYGEERGSRLAQAVGGAADGVFGLIEKHGIDCEPNRSGWIQAAPAEKALARVQQRGDEWAALGAPAERLDRAALARLTGTNAYLGGWIDRRAGTVQPLSYVRGLAKAAQRAGAKLHEGTVATALVQRNGRWEVTTSRGTISARRVLVGQDGYADGLVPGLAKTLICVQSALVATEQLPEALRARIMPGGICASETRRLAFYFRQSPDGRLVFGGRGAVGDAENPAFFSALTAAMHRTFPEAKGLAIAHRWSGQVALTLDGLPHIHEPESGLHIGVGYNGRGIAMATLMGQWLAARALDGTEPPLPVTKLSPILWHSLKTPAIQLGITWAWIRDRLGFAG